VVVYHRTLAPAAFSTSIGENLANFPVGPGLVGTPYKLNPVVP
jgi:hypothetical protein